VEIMKEETIKEIIRSYYKWKAVGVSGIWMGAAIASLFAEGEIKLAVMLLATLSSLLFMIFGIPEIQIES